MAVALPSASPVAVLPLAAVAPLTERVRGPGRLHRHRGLIQLRGQGPGWVSVGVHLVDWEV